MQYLPAKSMLESVKMKLSDGNWPGVENWPELLTEFTNLRDFHIEVYFPKMVRRGLFKFLPNLINVTKFTIKFNHDLDIELITEIHKSIKNLRVLEVILSVYFLDEKAIDPLQKIYLGLISVCRTYNAEISKGPLIMYYKNRKIVEKCRENLMKTPSYDENVVALKWNIQQTFYSHN